MLIGIDGNEANIPEKVGVHQYASELLNTLYRIQSEWQKDMQFIIYLKEPPLSFLPAENDVWKYKIIPGKRLWILSRLLPELYKTERPDVLFSPNHYLPVFTTIPQVCTIHDLGYLKFSEQFKKTDFWQLKCWSAISIFISKYIIAVSKSTQKEIVRHYRFASNKIRVVYHGCDHKKFNPHIYANVVRHITVKYRTGNYYILFLSMLKPGKNVEGLLEAFKLVKLQDTLYKLVIGGKKGWFYKSIFKKVKELCLENDVIFTDYVPEEDKPALLAGAKVFVSPSYWEGFGMHVLEAMACGTPVVVSNVASLPEVAGEAGIYCDPDDHGSIAEAVVNVLKMHSKEYNKCVDKTLKQAQKFSWEKTARETLQVLRNAGGK